MAVTWNIVNVESTIETGICNSLHWTATDSEVVSDITHTGSMYGQEGITGDSTAEGFIPFADVTEENCIAWVKEALGTEQVTEIEATIASQISESKAPVVRTTKPWEVQGKLNACRTSRSQCCLYSY